MRRILKDLCRKGVFYSKTAVLAPSCFKVSLFSLALFLCWNQKGLNKDLVNSCFKVPREYCCRRFLFVPLVWIILHVSEDLVQCQIQPSQGVYILHLWSMRGNIFCTLAFALTSDYVKFFCTQNPFKSHLTNVET